MFYSSRQIQTTRGTLTQAQLRDPATSPSLLTVSAGLKIIVLGLVVNYGYQNSLFDRVLQLIYTGAGIDAYSMFLPLSAGATTVQAVNPAPGTTYLTSAPAPFNMNSIKFEGTPDPAVVVNSFSYIILYTVSQ